MSPEKMADRADGESLWDFSVRVYGQPGVEEICIRLQEGWGVDVPVLLFALWRARHGCRFSRADIQKVVGATTAWQHEVVTPIRQLRRHLRDVDLLAPELADGMQAVQKEIQESELAAERRELEYLATIDVGASHEPSAATISANITTYLGFLDVPKPDQKMCRLLVDAALR